MLNVSQPQVLILPAGAATDQLKVIKSLKSVVVVDVGAASHMYWGEEKGEIPMKSWSELLETKSQFDPPEKLPQVAIQTVTKTSEGYQSIEFTHQVLLPLNGQLTGERHCGNCKST